MIKFDFSNTYILTLMEILYLSHSDKTISLRFPRTPIVPRLALLLTLISEGTSLLLNLWRFGVDVTELLLWLLLPLSSIESILSSRCPILSPIPARTALRLLNSSNNPWRSSGCSMFLSSWLLLSTCTSKSSPSLPDVAEQSLASKSIKKRHLLPQLILLFDLAHKRLDLTLNRLKRVLFIRKNFWNSYSEDGSLLGVGHKTFSSWRRSSMTE